jgi:hypothetical protein
LTSYGRSNRFCRWIDEGGKVPPKSGTGRRDLGGSRGYSQMVKAALKEGKKIEDFLIDKTMGKARVKRRAKK